MPTYDYICKDCHHQFEQFQSITAEPVQICPVCDNKSVERKISGGAGISFKGSGFYITDYKDKKPAQEKSKKITKEEKK